MSEKEARELLDTVKNLTASVEELTAANENLTAENKRLKQKLERMNELLLNAQRARFGQSSEKRSYVLPDSEQMRLFNEAEQTQDAKAEEPTEKTLVAAHERKKKRTNEELTKELPTQDVILDIPENQRICVTCGEEMACIGKKFLYEELQTIPKQVMRVRYYAKTYACKHCEEQTGYGCLTSAAPPPRLLKHSLASPSTVADVMTQKYVDGIPLARQEKIWKREGVELSRATLANWVIEVSRRWLRPLYRLIRKRLSELNVIHADETVVQVLKEDGKPATSESRMWVYASGRYEGEPIRFFEYQPDRSGKHPAALLKDFSGCMVTDGYAGYAQVLRAKRCGCWAHMRRKWREAMPKGATPATSQAAIGYEYCNKLFSLERKFETFAPKTRRQARQAQVEPLLDVYWAWVEKLDPAPGSKLEDAVVYARNQKAYLNEFLLHGEVDISNNIAENAIRPFVVGRKNWLFCDTPKGAEASAVVYTLVETAKANALDPFRYLNYVLFNIRFLGQNPSNEELEEFLPWNEAVRLACKPKLS